MNRLSLILGLAHPQPRQQLLRERADGDGLKVFDLTHSEDACA